MQPPRGRDVDALDLGGLAQPAHLLLRQRDVLVLEALQLTVLPLQEQAQRDGAEGADDLQRDAHAHGRAVVRRVLVAVGVGGPDAGGVADGVDEGVCDGALCGRAGDRVGDPRVQGAVLREDEDHEEEGEVARAEAGGGHEDDEADDGDGDRVHEEPEAVADAVGHVRVRHAVDDHEDVRRRHQQQRDDLVVAQRLGQRREEVLEAAGARDGHVREGQEVRLDVGEGQLHAAELAHAAALVYVGLGGLDGKPAVRHLLHLGRQEPPVVWEVRQQEADGEPDRAGDGALDDVQPLPRRHSAMASKSVEDAGGDEVAECAAEQRARVEDTHPESKLLLGVPLREVE